MLLRRIERYLRSTGTPPARFGRDVVGDPNFVFDLRNGREARAKTVDRVVRYLEAKDSPSRHCERSAAIQRTA